MIKRTLYFGNPAYLSLKLGQMVIKIPSLLGDDNVDIKTLPIEDIGIVILDNRQITVTQGLLEVLMDNNCALISCDSKCMPTGLMLSLEGNSIQSERFRVQIDASLPLKKNLWQQTVECKIRNQGSVLRYATGEANKDMSFWAKKVRSGDPDNMEGRAASYYWKHLFPDTYYFVRERGSSGVNALLNYGYAILRAIIARAIVGVGMSPTLGIHHHNRYNAYCLADDIMEPYRPYIDRLVLDICRQKGMDASLDKEIKAKLLTIATEDVRIDEVTSPLMIAASKTAASLYKCFCGELRKISYPILE